MARFRMTLQGEGPQVHRLAHRSASVTVMGWDIGVVANLYADHAGTPFAPAPGSDLVVLQIRGGSNDFNRTLVDLGRWAMKDQILVPADEIAQRIYLVTKGAFRP